MPGTAKSYETGNDSGDGNSTTRTAARDIAVFHHDAHREKSAKVVRIARNNRFQACSQLCLMYGTSDHEGCTGLFEQSMTYKFGSKIEVVEGRPNEFLELVRRYDEANGTDPVPDQVKRACIISSTTEPLKTHLQLNVSKVGTFDALRVATEDYLRSRRIFKTTSAGNTHEDDPMEVDVLSRKGKGKEKSGNGKKSGKKGKERVTLGKVTENRKWTTRALMVSVEIAVNTVTRLLICWYKQQHKTSRQR